MRFNPLIRCYVPSTRIYIAPNILIINRKSLAHSKYTPSCCCCVRRTYVKLAVSTSEETDNKKKSEKKCKKRTGKTKLIYTPDRRSNRWSLIGTVARIFMYLPYKPPCTHQMRNSKGETHKKQHRQQNHLNITAHYWCFVASSSFHSLPLSFSTSCSFSPVCSYH